MKLLLSLALSLYITYGQVPCEDQRPFLNDGECVNEGDICCVCVNEDNCEGCVVADCPSDTTTTLTPETTTTEAPDTTTTAAPDTTTVFGTTTTGKPCICPTKPSKSGSKSSSKSSSKKSSSKKSSSKEEGQGQGDCDCDGGMVELRFIYSGTESNVDIGIYDEKDSSSTICSFANVDPYDEIVCNLYGSAPGLDQQGLSKFNKDTRFVINHSDGSECAATYHTSCSRDITGIVMDECSELVVSGWADASGGDCDDGVRRRMMRRLGKSSGGIKGSKGSKSASAGKGGKGSGSKSKSGSDSLDFATTAFDIDDDEECICVDSWSESSESSEKSSSEPCDSSGSKSHKKSKSKSKSSSSSDGTSKTKKSTSAGLGYGDCCCEGGMVELRFIYSGTESSVDIAIYDEKDLSSTVCSFDDVDPDDEIVCNLYGSAPGLDQEGLSKFNKDTRFVINHSDGSECAATYHTSCSRDIVGIIMDECSELVVSGWADASGGDCDDEDTDPDTDTDTVDDDAVIADDVAMVVNDDGSLNPSDMLTAGGMRFNGFYAWIAAVCSSIFVFI